MRRAISVVLAATLVTTPIKLALAQAGQENLRVVETDTTRTVNPLMTTDSVRVRLGVPEVVPYSHGALLLAGPPAPTSVVALPQPMMTPPPISRGGKAALITLGILGGLALITLVFCVARGANCGFGG